MNENDAQFILESYRPGTEDDSDPMFREALEVAKHNPELLEWLHKNESIDTMFTRALEGITPPKELRLSIFTASATQQEIRAKTTSSTHAASQLVEKPLGSFRGRVFCSDANHCSLND